MNKLKTVALIARDTGLSILRETLLNSPRLELSEVYTHGKLPKNEGNGIRLELNEFKTICQQRSIRLQVLDYPEAKNLEQYLPETNYDLLISLSWRFLVPEQVLKKFKYGGINLHRGILPQYEGANPVERAIKNGEQFIGISGHKMSPEIDKGDVLTQCYVNISDLSGELDISSQVKKAKDRLLPLYNPILKLAIECMVASP